MNKMYVIMLVLSGSVCKMFIYIVRRNHRNWCRHKCSTIQWNYV